MQNLVQILRVQQRRHVLVVRIRIYAPLDGSRQRLEDLSNQVSTRDYSVHYNQDQLSMLAIASLLWLGSLT